MSDQQKGNAGKDGGGGQPKGWRVQRESEGGENSGFDRALQPDVLSEGVTCLIGLVGQSTREGYRVLFLSMDMNSRVEISDEDIVYSEKLSPEESPFGSLGGTRICVKKGATLDYSRTTARKIQAEELTQDEFDLDIQISPRGLSGGGQQGLMATIETRPYTICGTCGPGECETYPLTQCGGTCPRTQCGPTCPRTQCNTCYATCRTCPATQCATCPNTCADTCRRTQCDTCPRTQCLTCLPTECGGLCGYTLPATYCDCVTGSPCA